MVPGDDYCSESIKAARTLGVLSVACGLSSELPELAVEVARTSGMHILSFRGQLQGLCSGNVHLSFMTRVRPSRKDQLQTRESPGC